MEQTALLGSDHTQFHLPSLWNEDLVFPFAPYIYKELEAHKQCIRLCGLRLSDGSLFTKSERFLELVVSQKLAVVLSMEADFFL